jgi:lysozyme
MALPQSYLDKIKGFEGYNPKPYWDYKQWTSGYGTRANGPNDVVDQAEAERRLNDEMTKAAALVDQFAPGVDPGTRAALTSLTYNAGGSWMNSGLGQAIKSGDLDKARASFLQYTQAGGQHLPGLANRRAAEVGWFGQNASDPRNVAMNSGSAGVDPDGTAGISGSIHTQNPTDTGVASSAFTSPNTPPPTTSGGTGLAGAFQMPGLASMGKAASGLAGAFGGGGEDDQAMQKANAKGLEESERAAMAALQSMMKRPKRTMANTMAPIEDKRLGAFA